MFHSADRVVVIDRGRVIANDTPRKVGELLHSQGSPMFAALPTPTRVFYDSGAEGECPLTVREGRSWLTKTFENCRLTVTQPEPEPEAGKIQEAALTVKDAWFRYDREGEDILQGVSFQVERGSIHAIVGGNGAGKSTLLKAICGINRVYRGKVSVFGKDLKKYGGRELFRDCAAMLPQDPKSLFVKSTVRQELEEMTQDPAAIAEAARVCQVEHLVSKHPHDLSGGEQQRCALAKVLLTEPKLLLLDEPTKGLDSFFKIRFAQILKQLKAQGITVILVSHDVEFCADHADLISMFFDGQVLTTDTPHRFFGQNSFYTTAANRMSRCLFQNAVTAGDVSWLYRKNLEG